ncbi:MAG: hypothetical protein P8Y66_06775 [Nitrospirota bacterium]
MKEDRFSTLKAGRRVGAVVGGIIFVLLGIVPGLYFGSYATVVLLSHLTGGPIETGILTRALIASGIILGLFCTAALSIVAGSLAGMVLALAGDALTSTLWPRRKQRESQTAATVN